MYCSTRRTARLAEQTPTHDSSSRRGAERKAAGAEGVGGRRSPPSWSRTVSTTPLASVPFTLPALVGRAEGPVAGVGPQGVRGSSARNKTRRSTRSARCRRAPSTDPGGDDDGSETTGLGLAGGARCRRSAGRRRRGRVLPHDGSLQIAGPAVLSERQRRRPPRGLDPRASRRRRTPSRRELEDDPKWLMRGTARGRWGRPARPSYGRWAKAPSTNGHRGNRRAVGRGRLRGDPTHARRGPADLARAAPQRSLAARLRAAPCG